MYACVFAQVDDVRCLFFGGGGIQSLTDLQLTDSAGLADQCTLEFHLSLPL